MNLMDVFQRNVGTELEMSAKKEVACPPRKDTYAGVARPEGLATVASLKPYRARKCTEDPSMSHTFLEMFFAALRPGRKRFSLSILTRCIWLNQIITFNVLTVVAKQDTYAAYGCERRLPKRT
jgi:hypothetical protein